MGILRTPYEHLLNWFVQLDPSRREILMSLLALIVVIGSGTLGYRLIEGWPWMDGLFMTFITLTTIGFAEVRPLSDLGRVFTILIALSGIGIVTFVAARAAQLLLASERLSERRTMKQIQDLSGHYIICGYGRVGQRLADDLAEADKDFVVIDQSEQEIDQLRDRNWLYVRATPRTKTLSRKPVSSAPSGSSSRFRRTARTCS